MPPSAPFTIDATMIGDWQACRRRSLLAADWVPGRWRPKALFAMCLRRGIMMLSSTATPDPRLVSTELQSEYMEIAADPGLDVHDRSPYHVARDYCALLDTVLHGLARSTLLVLHERSAAPINPSLSWRFTSSVDDAGRLHRWVIADAWTNDALTREMHSWRTIGDVAVAESPLTLHVVVLGPVRYHRHHSAWARAWRHPSIPHLPVRFVAKDRSGQALKSWKAHWFVDEAGGLASDWIERAAAEDVIDALLPSVHVNVPPAEACAQVRRELCLEGAKMREALIERESGRWREWPMSRNACDGIIPCPYQDACYGEIVPLGSIGFTPRTPPSREELARAAWPADPASRTPATLLASPLPGR